MAEQNKYLNKIILGDSREVLKKLDNESIDLVVTSPPYPGATMWSDDDETITEQIERLTELNNTVLELCANKVKNGGVICWNICNVPIAKVKRISPNVEKTVLYAIDELDLSFRGNIIWDKGVYRIPPYPFMRRPVIPNLIHEHILVFFVGDWIPREKNSHLGKNERSWYASNVWRFNAETQDRRHIAPFPIELPFRCISLWSLEGDTVLDPYCGSGSTTVAAKRLNRNYIGIEKDEYSFALSQKRMNQKLLKDFVE